MTTFIDLSHTIEDGMITYNGLPAPIICDWLTFDDSHKVYGEGTEFTMQTIELHSNTGTYIDTPRHRYRDGHDLCGLSLDRISSVPAICIDAALRHLPFSLREGDRPRTKAPTWGALSPP